MTVCTKEVKHQILQCVTGWVLPCLCFFQELEFLRNVLMVKYIMNFITKVAPHFVVLYSSPECEIFINP